jgi:hypothetical protein
MAQQDQNTNPKGQNDDPRQAFEEGDQATGRVRGRPAEMQDEEGANRTNPDASSNQGKKDVSTTTPHRESGDRA